MVTHALRLGGFFPFHNTEDRFTIDPPGKVSTAMVGEISKRGELASLHSKKSMGEATRHALIILSVHHIYTPFISRFDQAMIFLSSLLQSTLPRWVSLEFQEVLAVYLPLV